ncbi:DciA family protein [Neisseria wadsworthii]|uniref:DUF721 domain-containing protein n=1 Tax=Neisseria wadsworthii 9715 TaxID=1030841 RepID=G4CQ83_9NEIS|nr:DciA family protein [Neisseria wadsworthii]EGZ46811.1 hypothetical protein HMPREF9370_1243 [Neisseria wadsworthii 9715]QMT35009.1 DUF721 domain-containing protein [Neisseria wadsworthii]
MDLDQLGKRDNRLASLLAQAQQWHRLDRAIKKLLPPNLHGYTQVACIDAEGCLIILAANNMALSRLRMIAPGLLTQMQHVDQRIESVRIKAAPKPDKPAKQNMLTLSENALDAFDDSAERVAHHPDLAAALRKLVNKRR